ncbi:MAG: 50S ribosomal protein L13 [Thermoplasmata archaeon]|nr:50S ribosomal protein L13 [Thermoplasmata archaeon]
MQVIDGSEHIMGRLATYVAQQLLAGEEIYIVNAENLVITGRREQILKDYKERRDRGVSGPNRFGPYYPRMPDRLFKRTVRGMVPFDQPRGRTAIKRLKVYMGVPKEMKGVEFMKIEKALDRGATKKMRLGEVATWLGADF